MDGSFHYDEAEQLAQEAHDRLELATIKALLPGQL